MRSWIIGAFFATLGWRVDDHLMLLIAGVILGVTLDRVPAIRRRQGG